MSTNPLPSDTAEIGPSSGIGDDAVDISRATAIQPPEREAGFLFSNHGERHGTLIGVLALVLWASSVPFARRCIEELGPFTTGALQYGIGGLVGLLAQRFEPPSMRLSRAVFRHRPFYLRVAMFAMYMGMLYTALEFVARDKLPVVILLNYLWPTCTLVIALFVTRRSVHVPLFLVGTAVVVLGIAYEIVGENVVELLATPHDAVTLVAYVLAFGGAVVWGAYSALNKGWGDRGGGTAGLPALMLIVASIMLVARLATGESSSFSHEVVAPLIYLCVLPYFANACWDIGTRKGNVPTISLLADLLPWFALVITYLYLDVAIGYSTIVSAFAIVVGAILTRYSLKPERSP